MSIFSCFQDNIDDKQCNTLIRRSFLATMQYIQASCLSDNNKCKARSLGILYLSGDAKTNK
ncbi:MAG TPA: hypothetical protein PKD51_16505, partial [Saprospiraceae bacterium]|nr:hypothetical protein [Saprospiraceae bacterium]